MSDGNDKISDLQAFGRIAMFVNGEPEPRPGHDGNWCRDCQDGCGDEYGGACDCCTAWSREDTQ